VIAARGAHANRASLRHGRTKIRAPSSNVLDGARKFFLPPMN
jgi:hypothetical protein